ncbi:hypothetical protein G4B88_028166 [Cannabis sativa]|uniref:Uncharacterized protein n=1 Tax=Cannabis sativa TaxID=3483 RepID=A0A7J6HU59_CANSA|nr:hypothetical protein G4B88_028166 [Cannabis sativa]
MVMKSPQSLSENKSVEELFGCDLDSNIIGAELRSLHQRLAKIDVSTILTNRVIELKTSSQESQENINSKGMEFMLETICDIKNNKKRSKDDPPHHTRSGDPVQRLETITLLLLPSLNSQSHSNSESHHLPLFLCLKGSQELNGNEVDTIISFKNALGIDDPEAAAAMHMEIGRRLFRQRLETGDQDGLLKERRAFQKLIYVSTLVFGDASSFLLPWKRVFKVIDSQVEIAIRDNAQRLYATKLKSISTVIGVIGSELYQYLPKIFSLREAQLLYRLSDEHVADLFREHTRKLIEKHISSALTLLKSKTRATYTLYFTHNCLYINGKGKSPVKVLPSTGVAEEISANRIVEEPPYDLSLFKIVAQITESDLYGSITIMVSCTYKILT